MPRFYHCGQRRQLIFKGKWAKSAAAEGCRGLTIAGRRGSWWKNELGRGFEGRQTDRQTDEKGFTCHVRTVERFHETGDKMLVNSSH